MIHSEEHIQSIYSVLKAESDNTRFCFLTGITRFCKMSVLSGFNNLEDITLEPDYTGIRSSYRSA